MEIQIITKKVKGWLLPFVIIKGTKTNWVLKIKIKNFTGQEKINYTWILRYGQNYANVMTGSTKELKIQPEQLLKWSFIPYQSGEQKLELLITGLDPLKDIVLDDYRSKISIQSNKLPLINYTVRYHRVFEVEKSREMFLFLFAIASAIGAFFEILSFFLARS